MKTHPMPTATLAAAMIAAIGSTADLSAADLLARWSFGETSPPYADAGPNAIFLVQDAATAQTGSGIAGNAAQLNWQPDPGVATRLSANDTALQTDSFGFSLWINPVFLSAGDVVLSKEMDFDDSIPNFQRKAWQLQVIGSGQLELIVRGDNRVAGDFFGAVQSAATLTLQGDTPDWIHIAGGYDAVTGALSLYVNGVADFAAGSPGATNSDGAPLSIGTQRNGADFIEFAAGAQIDEVQIFNAPLAADEVAYLKANADKTVADRPAPNLAAHWKLDETSAPYASSASAPADLLQDADTTPALTESPSLVGNAAVLGFGTPPVATRLHTSAGAIQTDSFGFSFWIRPDSLNGDEVLLMKESPADTHGDPAFSLCAWKLSVLPDADSNGYSPLQLVVRGADRDSPEPFFGDVTSSAEFQLQTSSSQWIHVAGGYDAITGALALYVNDGNLIHSTDSRIAAPGANHSDGSALSVGSARNGANFVGFAVGAAIDDLQMYDGLLTSAQAAGLAANPGSVLAVSSEFRITTYAYDPVSGDMTLTFESSEGASYNLDASTTLGAWITVKPLTGTGSLTSATITKAELDAALGVAARPRAFIRVARP